MRAFILTFALAAALPAAAQAEPTAAPAAKPKRVCHFLDTGNPMKIERVCHTVAAPTPAPAETAVAEPPVVNAQVELAEKPKR